MPKFEFTVKMSLSHYPIGYLVDKFSDAGRIDEDAKYQSKQSSEEVRIVIDIVI